MSRSELCESQRNELIEMVNDGADVCAFEPRNRLLGKDALTNDGVERTELFQHAELHRVRFRQNVDHVENVRVTVANFFVCLLQGILVVGHTL